jgi:hypothetical protein
VVKMDSERILRLAGNLLAGCTGPSKCVDVTVTLPDPCESLSTLPRACMKLVVRSLSPDGASMTTT